MTRLKLIAALCLFAGLSTVACSKAIKPLPDKNTNWLRACDSDAECGSELACLCGACTKACTSTRQCGAAAEAAVCIEASDASLVAVCGRELEVAGVCSATCDRDSDCAAQAKGLKCQSGLCVPRGEMPSETTEPTDDCEPGDMIASICHGRCPGLNETAFATCGDDHRYGLCECIDPKCGPATDCAPGYTCLGNRCVEAANTCNGVECEDGEQCVDQLCTKILADGFSMPGDVALTDDGWLYFVNTGTFSNDEFQYDAAFVRVPADGSAAPTRLAEDLNPIGRMTVEGDNAYWFSMSKEGRAFQVMGATLPSGPVNAIFNTGEATSSLVAAADWLYWMERATEDNGLKLMRAPRDLRDSPKVIMDLAEGDSSLIRRADRLYWGSKLGVWSMSDGGDLQRLSRSAGSAGDQFALAVAVDEAGVYWAWSNAADIGLSMYDTEAQMSIPLTESMQGRVDSRIAVEGMDVYWMYTASNSSSELVRTSKAPYSTEVIWRNPPLRADTNIVVRDGFLYTSTVFKQVVRIRLPPRSM
jgi:hypothetical protein